MRWLLAVTFIFAGRIAHPAAVDYGRDVQPILADNCYQCHGPDENARKAKLRLDTQEGALTPQEGKSAIVAGNPAASALVARITSKDPEERMPPAESHRKLTPAQIELLTRWVGEGAPWGKHWAFETPRSPGVPRTKMRNWARHDIDRFILARLEAERMQPSREADRALWLRRVSLDLTGLPPTIEELDTFLADRTARAHEKVVDRLLNSPAFGERMAVEWLDTARYADTHGFQMDRYRPAWPYRDWVIEAFNSNLPMDQFIQWQLAGDLLPNPTRSQRLATAFNRLHLQNEEGGIVEEEFRTSHVVDRVNTLGTAFLGLTLDCARCHDHKYDPISQKDFYRLFAFFNNIDEFGQTSYFTDSTPVPAMLLTDPATDQSLAHMKAKVRQLESQQARLVEQARPAFEAWLKTWSETEPKPALDIPGLRSSFSFEEWKDQKSPNSVEAGKPAEGRDDPKPVEGFQGRGVELTGDNGMAFRGSGAFSRHDPFTLALALRPNELAPRQVVLHRSMAANDAGSRGYEILLEAGRVAVGLHHMWPGNSLKVVSETSLPVRQWTHLTVTYDGSSQAKGLKLYLDGRPVRVEIVRDGLTKDMTYERGDPDLQVGFRFRDNGFKDGRFDELRIFHRALTEAEVAQVAGVGSLSETLARAAKGDPEGRERGLAFFTATRFPPARNFEESLRHLRREHGSRIQSIPEMMVMREMEHPRVTRILKRGAYDAPAEAVTAGTPEKFPDMASDWPRNRLGLAKWLTSESQPLTARVWVNRAWQLMFGTGLVESSDNFGTQGSRPTHPELLDWLAVRFRQQGWNWKGLLKEIALSSTYRQSSSASAELRSRDPANALLARGPSQRLTAEMLRDQALAVSGLLTVKLGGPSVKPYQPEGLWEEKAMGAPRYEQSKGEDLYRKSLYTFWKRTVPPPAAIVFDAAERNTCLVRRQSTSTPLQALALMNDPQMTEAARFLSERMLKEAGDSKPDRLSWLFRKVTARPASDSERAVLVRMFEEQRAAFTEDPDSAARLLSVGDSANDPALSLADLAAGTMVAKAILNHDAAVMKR
ncbi:MAG: DUF1553 domain-containing protein [Verrucomicrobia bacterium]|nr:DUF1553 domain-containing protein [Verrucomicrobiota bacterium]